MNQRKPLSILRRIAPAIAISFLLAASNAVEAAPTTHFSQSQVNAGKREYAQNCAACHGYSLQGGAGPVLKGSKFASSLKFGNMSAKQLYDFVAQHMPKNDPGSLSEKHYLQIFSYILSKNGFASGKTDLTKKGLKNIKLLPFPGQQSGN